MRFAGLCTRNMTSFRSRCECSDSAREGVIPIRDDLTSPIVGNQAVARRVWKVLTGGMKQCQCEWLSVSHVILSDLRYRIFPVARTGSLITDFENIVWEVCPVHEMYLIATRSQSRQRPLRWLSRHRSIACVVRSSLARPLARCHLAND